MFSACIRNVLILPSSQAWCLVLVFERWSSTSFTQPWYLGIAISAKAQQLDFPPSWPLPIRKNSHIPKSSAPCLCYHCCQQQESEVSLPITSIAYEIWFLWSPEHFYISGGLGICIDENWKQAQLHLMSSSFSMIYPSHSHCTPVSILFIYIRILWDHSQWICVTIK
jgi:hypothetical protein